MEFKRSSGVLMHISSLPGPFGIGTFGQEAYQFVDFLVETKQTYWQILPLTTTSYGDSPYQSFSAIAGNTNFIDFAELTKMGLLDTCDYEEIAFGDDIERVDYQHLFEVRRPILEKAVQRFLEEQTYLSDFQIFCQKNEWLQDYAEFMAIKEHFSHVALQEWPDQKIRNRDALALEHYRKLLKEEIVFHCVTQYFFDLQWHKLKAYSNKNGIEIIGDMPIYVASDSVEVWTKPQLFKVDKDLTPLYVAGCPADDFSKEGQLWGNPIYDWAYHSKTNFNWWVYRIKESFKRYDILRIDHFKGFSDYWEIPKDFKTPNDGKWVSGPGYALFEQIKQELGDLPIIAENLGYIDKKAQQLLTDTCFPGMKILQFGFYDLAGESLELPHHYDCHQVVYTGTHDNPVINGWYQELDASQRKFVRDYTHKGYFETISQALLRTLYNSVANIAIVTMQDLLEKKSTCRMNLPNTIGKNWEWRMKKEDLTSHRKAFLKELTVCYNRANHRI